jgi:hypothetical protein
VIAILLLGSAARLVPETKGSSLEEIQDDIGSKARKRDHVGRHSTA